MNEEICWKAVFNIMTAEEIMMCVGGFNIPYSVNFNLGFRIYMAIAICPKYLHRAVEP